MKSETIFKEIDDLLTLLESISDTEYEIERSIQKTVKRRYAFSFLFALAIIIIIFLASNNSSALNIQQQFGVAVAITIVLFMFVIEFKTNIEEQKKLRIKKEMEFEIKRRIISIIHNQISRMEAEDMLSPILHATIEMRLRRAEIINF